MPGIELNGRTAAYPQCPAASALIQNTCTSALALVVLSCALGAPVAHALTPQQPLKSTASAPSGAASAPVDANSARALAQWVSEKRDHQGKPFFLVDKINATLYVFDGDARLMARSPVLLGAAVGDDSVPGIGNRPMAQILPSERTTPAGRFVAEAGRNLQGEDVVWVDHDAAVSMHRLRSSHPVENRAHRMVTPTVSDNRISYGCINVPVAFFNRYIQPAFVRNPTAMVYVLPETRSMEQQFGIAPASTSRPATKHATFKAKSRAPTSVLDLTKPAAATRLNTR